MLASLVRYHEGGGQGRRSDETENAAADAETFLGAARDESGALFLDADGELFAKFVIPYLRSGKVIFPSDADDRARLALEADYLQLTGLNKALAAPRPWHLSSPSSCCSSLSSELGGASSLWLPADEARARAAMAGPEGALDEALCERGGRLLVALELVLSLARGWILAPGGGGENYSSSSLRNVSASAATTVKPPPIICRLRGRGVCRVARPGCFDAFVEEGVVSCGLSSTTSSASSSSQPLTPSISNAGALISRLSSTVEREIAAENCATSPTQQRTISTFSSLSPSNSSAATETATATAALNLSTTATTATSHAASSSGPRTSYSFSRELEAEFDAPIMIGGGYDKAIYCRCSAEESTFSEGEGNGNDNGNGNGNGSNGNKQLDWEKCTPVEKNRIVYSSLSSTPLDDPTEAAIKESILALAERPTLVRALLVRRFGFGENTTVRASLETKISWRPSKTYCSADLFECVQAACVIDLAMP